MEWRLINDEQFGFHGSVILERKTANGSRRKSTVISDERRWRSMIDDCQLIGTLNGAFVAN